MDILEHQFPLLQTQIWKDYPPAYCKRLFEDLQKYCHNLHSPYEQTLVHTVPLAIRAINLPFMTTMEVNNFPRNPYWPKNPSPDHLLSIQSPYLKWFYLTFQLGSLSYYDFFHNNSDTD